MSTRLSLEEKIQVILLHAKYESNMKALFRFKGSGKIILPQSHRLSQRFVI